MTHCWILPTLLLHAALATSVVGPVEQGAPSTCAKSSCAGSGHQSLLQVARAKQPRVVNVRELEDDIDVSVEDTLETMYPTAQKHPSGRGEVKDYFNGDDHTNKTQSSSDPGDKPPIHTDRKNRSDDSKDQHLQNRTTPPTPHRGNCIPMCKWSCTEPACEEICTPQCLAPRCETRCSAVDLRSCMMECARPQCATVCPKTPCPGDNGHQHLMHRHSSDERNGKNCDDEGDDEVEEVTITPPTVDTTIATTTTRETTTSSRPAASARKRKNQTAQASLMQLAKCPECVTKCSQPRCKLKCPAEQNCKALCETPKCQWKCRKPERCPIPRCRLECEASTTCNTVVTKPLPPLKKGEIKVSDFEPKMSLLQIMPGSRDSGKSSSHKGESMMALVDSEDGAAKYMEFPMSA